MRLDMEIDEETGVVVWSGRHALAPAMSMSLSNVHFFGFEDKSLDGTYRYLPAPLGVFTVQGAVTDATFINTFYSKGYRNLPSRSIPAFASHVGINSFTEIVFNGRYNALLKGLLRNCENILPYDPHRLTTSQRARLYNAFTATRFTDGLLEDLLLIKTPCNVIRIVPETEQPVGSTISPCIWAPISTYGDVANIIQENGFKIQNVDQAY